MLEDTKRFLQKLSNSLEGSQKRKTVRVSTRTALTRITVGTDVNIPVMNIDGVDDSITEDSRELALSFTSDSYTDLLSTTAADQIVQPSIVMIDQGVQCYTSICKDQIGQEVLIDSIWYDYCHRLFYYIIKFDKLAM